MKFASTLLAFALLLSAHRAAIAADEPVSLNAAFQSHCVKCHGKGRKVAGDVNLVRLQTTGELQSDPDLLENLIEVLSDRRMPPEDELQPTDVERQHMIAELQAALKRSLSSKAFRPIPIRRMNRFQYNNAVVDLLELDRDIFQLNERLMRRREDYFRPATKKMPDQVRVSCRPLSKDIDNQRPEGFRGVAAFPQDQRAEHGFDNRADHLTLSPLLMESFLHLSRTIAESPDLNPRECRSWDWLFAPPGQPSRGSVAGRMEGESDSQIRIVSNPGGGVAPQEMRSFGSGWSGSAQLFWTCPEKNLELQLSFVAPQAGTGLRFGFTKAPDYGIFEIRLDDVKIGENVDLYHATVVPGQHTLKDVKVNPGQHSLKFRCVGKSQLSVRHFFGLDCVEILGARTEKAEKTVLTEAEAIRSRLRKLLRRAFRAPVNPETLDRFAGFAEHQLADGASFEEAMRTVVGAVLGMPEFLYLYDGAGTELPQDADHPVRQRVSEFELASRLAQFFWSSIPDDTLLDLAEAGTLSKPETLTPQIDRMMNDRRSSRFCDNFPGQWLQLDRLVTAIPDRQKYPYFYYHGYRTSMHMMSEPLLLFETVFIEDRSIMELLNPAFTWQSGMLQANYEGKAAGGHDVQVQTFKRVPLDDPRRGGVITNAAVMTMTSTPVRTQPITRGAWVNAVIFNDPPKPPPADVPPLPEADAEELAKLTIRERLAIHRKRADCAGCHNKIDPLGFALENYGPTGVWRDQYENGRDVDVAGKLFNQYEFSRLTEFKELLLQQKHRFIRGFVSHLLSYALGRELGPADSPALDKMTEKAVSGEDTMRALLRSVATSEPFLHKSTRGAN